METCIVRGGNKLEGEVEISGSKNTALCLIAACLSIKKKTRFHRIPHLSDIHNFLNILKYLHVSFDFDEDGTLTLDPTQIKITDLIMDEVRNFRASYYLIGALLKEAGTLRIAYPGGCSFDYRPIDIHLQFFKDMGVSVSEEKNILQFKRIQEKVKKEITLKNISFGATVNAILFCMKSKEEIQLNNVSPECEIDFLIQYLNKAGANIEKKKNSIYIHPVKEYHETTFTNMFDRMETGTFAFLGGALGSLRLKGVDKRYVASLERALFMSGAQHYFAEDTLVVRHSKEQHSVIMETGIYPLFPTDLQPILTAYLLSIPRIHVIRENIYQERFSHVEELKKMGAMITRERDTLLINGIFTLHSAEMMAKDLRCGAALLLAGLLVPEESQIHHAEVLKRGYERIYEKLHLIGADVGVKKC